MWGKSKWSARIKASIFDSSWHWRTKETTTNKKQTTLNFRLFVQRYLFSDNKCVRCSFRILNATEFQTSIFRVTNDDWRVISFQHAVSYFISDLIRLHKKQDYFRLQEKLYSVDFLREGFRKVSSPYFLYVLLEEIFFLLYSINWEIFMVWFPYFFRY